MVPDLFFCPQASADNATGLVTESRPLLHTFVEIKAYGDNAREAIEAAFAEMSRVNDLLNNYDSGSEVSNINRNAGGEPVPISPETMEALQAALKFSSLSGGALDITVGPLLQLWGFAQENPGLAGGEPDRAAIKKAKTIVDYRAVELVSTLQAAQSVRTARLRKSGMWIDVGSFSKGYAADRAMTVLKQRGIKNALISAGGTICAIGCKANGAPWKVAVRHPRKDDTMLTFIALQDGAVSTSGDYERFYEKKGKRRGHIIDPRTGAPVERMQSVSVIAKTGVDSDALSTALFVLGPDKGIALVNRLPGVAALLVSHAGNVVMSSAWPEKKVVY
jgi:thiamine biosynthesis lipoprotein